MQNQLTKQQIVERLNQEIASTRPLALMLEGDTVRIRPNESDQLWQAYSKYGGAAYSFEINLHLDEAGHTFSSGKSERNDNLAPLSRSAVNGVEYSRRKRSALTADFRPRISRDDPVSAGYDVFNTLAIVSQAEAVMKASGWKRRHTTAIVTGIIVGVAVVASLAVVFLLAR